MWEAGVLTTIAQYKRVEGKTCTLRDLPYTEEDRPAGYQLNGSQEKG